MQSWLSPQLDQNKKRIEGLDLLRAYAIIFVVFSHGSEIIKPFLPQYLFRLFYTTGGFIGVELFFVLSGFLVGTIFIRTISDKNSITLKTIQYFWISRWFRTLPSYYLIFLVYVGLYFISKTYLSPSTTPLYLIFCQNLAWPHPDFFNVSWSLALEEWFYLLLPILYCITAVTFPSKTIKTRLLYLLLFVLIISPIVRAIMINKADLELWDITIRKVVIWRLDAIMWGVLMAWIATFRTEQLEYLRKFTAIGFVLILLTIVLLNGFTPNQLQQNLLYPAMNIGTFLIVPYFLTYQFKSKKVREVITNISASSYAIYLLHSFICVAFIKVFPATQLITGILYLFIFFISTYLSAVIFFNFYEHPITALRNKFSR